LRIRYEPIAAVAASALLRAAGTHGAQFASGWTTIDRDAVVPQPFPPCRLAAHLVII
jgi:hypothetical protein